MPDSRDKLHSDILQAKLVQEAMLVLPNVLRPLIGDCIVTARYGFGTEIHADLQYVPMRVGTQWIDRFIIDSIERGIVVPGHSDFAFTTPGEAMAILFCHESDIHLSGNDPELIERFITAQPFAGFHFRSKTVGATNA